MNSGAVILLTIGVVGTLVFAWLLQNPKCLDLFYSPRVLRLGRTGLHRTPITRETSRAHIRVAVIVALGSFISLIVISLAAIVSNI